jgi:hypothetical protein
MKREWYTIILQNGDYTEEVAKVRTRGLAEIVKMTLIQTYKNTEYKVDIKEVIRI